MGKREVTGNGTLSVIHHTEIQTVTAITATASLDMPNGCTNKISNRNNKGPAQNPMRYRKFSLLLLAPGVFPSVPSISGLIYYRHPQVRRMTHVIFFVDRVFHAVFARLADKPDI